MTRAKPRWPRILLKLSGEAFAGEAGYGIDGKIVEQLASEIVEAQSQQWILDAARRQRDCPREWFG